MVQRVKINNADSLNLFMLIVRQPHCLIFKVILSLCVSLYPRSFQLVIAHRKTFIYWEKNRSNIA